MILVNNINIEQEFGIVLAEGAYKELWKLPKAKPAYEFDWNGENGIETDPLQVNVFERLQYSVPLLITSNDEVDYWDKFNSWAEFVLNNRYVTMDVPDRNRRFKLVNLGIDNYDDFVEQYTPFSIMNWLLANDNPKEIIKII